MLAFSERIQKPGRLLRRRGRVCQGPRRRRRDHLCVSCLLECGRTSSGDTTFTSTRNGRTSVSFLVTAAKSSCGGNNKKAKKILPSLAILLRQRRLWRGLLRLGDVGELAVPSARRRCSILRNRSTRPAVSARYGHGTPVASRRPSSRVQAGRGPRRRRRSRRTDCATRL